jgi:hypothetical protein
MAVLLPMNIHIKSRHSDAKQSPFLLLIVWPTLLKMVAVGHREKSRGDVEEELIALGGQLYQEKPTANSRDTIPIRPATNEVLCQSKNK